MTVRDEWVSKAEADYVSAVDLNRRRREPVPDVVCYHCQQCAEKYLKAFLVVQGVLPPRTHDLVDLLRLCSVSQPALVGLRPEADLLNPYGAAIRYPGPSATVADARDALQAVRRIRRVMRRVLGV